jgi:hypothetical protein
LRRVALFCCLAGSVGVQAQSSAPPVAGLKPDRRPEGAPVVPASPADASTKATRLNGITTPWPGNVERIAEQGNWYSPMFVPGMPGRYDLRRLHEGKRP